MSAEDRASNRHLHNEIAALRLEVSRLQAALADRPGAITESALNPADQFRALFDAMREGVALHAMLYDSAGKPVDYRLLDINPAYERHTGIPATQARGRLATEVYESDTPPFLDKFAQVTQSGHVLEMDLEFPTGSGHHYRVVAIPLGTGRFATIFEDTSARNRMGEELRSSEARYRTLIETAPAAVIVLSPDGSILEFNPEAERAYGVVRADVVGQDYYEHFLPLDERARVAEQVRQVIAGKPSRAYENRIRRASGEERAFVWNADCLRNDRGSVIGIVAIGQDNH